MSIRIDFSKFYQPKPKQILAHRCKARYVLFGGAMGGGKSWFLCADAILNAMQYNGNRLVIVRKESSVMKRTILVTFLNICPPEIIESFNQTSLVVKFINGSVLQFMEANISKDPLVNKIKGLEVGWVGIDEANEIDERVFDILKARLRWVLPDGKTPPYKIRLTSNPENCWLIPRFIESKSPDHIFIQSLTTDNYDENSEYMTILREAFKDNPEMAQRYLDGSWAISDSINQLIRGEIIDLADYDPANGWGDSLGCDVARYGKDTTAFACIKSGFLKFIEEWDRTSIPQVQQRTIQLVNDHNLMWERVGIDEIGVGGGVVDLLKEAGCDVLGIIGGAAAEDNESIAMKPANLRTQMFLALRDDMANQVVGGFNRLEPTLRHKLREELKSIKYFIESDRKIRVVGKDEIKKEIGRSPNLVDALAYSNWARRRTISESFIALPFIGGI
jgi:phage terminase large subunit